MANKSLEELYPDTYKPVCSTIDSYAQKLLFVTGRFGDSLESWGDQFDSWMTEQTQFISDALSKCDEWLETLDKMVQTNYVPDLVKPEFINDVYLKNPALRRYMGEYLYWQTWEALNSANSGVEGSIFAFYDTYKKWIKSIVLSYLDTLDFNGVNAYVERVVIYGLIPYLYKKFIPMPILPSYLYPQVTTRSQWKGNEVGLMIRPENYRAPVYAMPDPSDPMYLVFKNTQDLSVLTKPLLNESIYRPAESYWKSNWRDYNLPIINGTKVGYINENGLPIPGAFFHHIDDSTAHQGPTSSNFNNHLIKMEASFPSINNKGEMTENVPWSEWVTYKEANKGVQSAFNIPFDSSSDKFFKLPELENINPMFKRTSSPSVDDWAVIDIIYEFQMLLASTDGVCISHSGLRKSWEGLLKNLGFQKYAEKYSVDLNQMWTHIANDRLNNDPVIFGTSIVEWLLSPLYVLETQLNAKTSQIRSIVSGW